MTTSTCRARSPTFVLVSFDPPPTMFSVPPIPVTPGTPVVSIKPPPYLVRFPSFLIGTLVFVHYNVICHILLLSTTTRILPVPNNNKFDYGSFNFLSTRVVTEMVYHNTSLHYFIDLNNVRQLATDVLL